MQRIISLFSVILIAICCYGNTLNTDLPRGAVDTRMAAAVKAFRQNLLAIDTTHTTKFYNLMSIRHGEVVYNTGFDCSDSEKPRETYSIGKTLVALGVGCAVDEGRLRLSDRVIDFFPDKLPAHMPKGMRDMTLRHLLTMNCGLEENATLMSVFSPATQRKDTIDWIREFFASPMPHEPGTYFYYNLYATHIVCAIVEKVTGMPFIDYIMPRLLTPLGISNLQWEKSPQGICAGGWGAKLCPEDLAKIGQLMLQGGVWQGKRLISKRWMKKMTSKQVPSAPHVVLNKNTVPQEEDKNEIHSQGYGFFVWFGHHGTYRAEGLGGQVIIVNPKKDAVLVIMLNTVMYKEFYDLIDQYLIPVM